jgi:transposase
VEHVAIDLGGRESQICVRGADGSLLEEKRCPTARLSKYLQARPKSRVVVETCAESFTIADAALSAGHEVRVVPATLVRALGVGARGIKTDRRDAQILSEVSCRIDLPSVHIPSTKAREWKSICGMRDSLVATRTMLINTVRGWLRRQARRIRRGAVETFPLRVREALGVELPSYVERQLVVLELVTEQVKGADNELARIAKEDAVARRLMSVPGVGPVTSVRFIAALDEIGRFPSAHKVQSYLGLVPGEDSSSERQRRTSITKAGPAALRWTLVQAAWSARRSRGAGQPVLAWATEVEKRRGKRVAIVALARKLAGILFAIWRDGTTYDRSRGASPPTACG